MVGAWGGSCDVGMELQAEAAGHDSSPVHLFVSPNKSYSLCRSEFPTMAKAPSLARA